MDKYYKEQCLEIIEAIKHSINELDEAIPISDTVKELLKSIEEIIIREQLNKDALEIVKETLKKIDSKNLEIESIRFDIELLEDIIKRELS